MISDDELDLLEADRLFDALARRYQVCVFVAATDQAKTPGGSQIFSLRLNHGGDRLRVMGLCHYLASEMSRELFEDLVPEGEEGT